MEPSWRVLGTSWGVLGEVVSSEGRLGDVLAAFWRRPGLSWERLGAVLGAVWAVLGRLGVVLKPSWSALWLSWAILEAILLA